MVSESSVFVDRSPVAIALPNFFANCGVWQGFHRSIDIDGNITSVDERCVEVSFPVGLDYQHVSRGLAIADDGTRVVLGEVRGQLAGAQIRWDEAEFHGRCWDTESGITILEIIRKDDPGLSFRELITLSDCGGFRTRTLHWYRDGIAIRRTLCDEWRLP